MLAATMSPAVDDVSPRQRWSMHIRITDWHCKKTYARLINDLNPAKIQSTGFGASFGRCFTSDFVCGPYRFFERGAGVRKLDTFVVLEMCVPGVDVEVVAHHGTAIVPWTLRDNSLLVHSG